MTVCNGIYVDVNLIDCFFTAIFLLALHDFAHRLQLAALHFNENSNRKQAITKSGKERYDVVFPKYKKGGYVVRKVVVKPTYGMLIVLPNIHHNFYIAFFIKFYRLY